MDICVTSSGSQSLPDTANYPFGTEHIHSNPLENTDVLLQQKLCKYGCEVEHKGQAFKNTI